LLGGKPETFGGMPCGPLADAVEGLAAEEQVLEQDQQGSGRGDAAPPVFGGEVVAEELLESEPAKESIEDRQGGDAPGVQCAAAGVGDLAGSWSWGVSVVSRSLRLVHRRSSRRSQGHRDAGDRGVRPPAAMMSRGAGSSRGEKFSD
jgi:hypothetical protein